MASLRMGIVLILLIPFWRFKIPNKKYLPSLIAFSISMGVMVYVFMTLSLYHSSIISPVIVGSQLAIPFGVLLSGIMLGENISLKKWILIFCAFFGIVIIFFDPELADNFLGLFYASLKASSADAAIAGVRDSIGPVNPKMIPILIACPSAITLVPKLEIGRAHV